MTVYLFYWCVGHFWELIKTSTKPTENVLVECDMCAGTGQTDSPGGGRRLRKLLASFFGGFYYYFSFLVRLLGICYSCVCVKPQDRQYECKLKTRQRRHAETGRKRAKEVGGKWKAESERRSKNCAQCGNENKCACVSYEYVRFCFLGDENREENCSPQSETATERQREKERGRGGPRDVPKEIKNNFQNKNFLSCARESSSNSCCSCCCSPF